MKHRTRPGERHTRVVLSIPSAGRQPMKPICAPTASSRARSFNTLCGSSANEAKARADDLALEIPFNTLCGSSANEAYAFALNPSRASVLTFNTLCGSSANEAPAARPCISSWTSSFNTLCGSSANEAWCKGPCARRWEPLSIPSAGRQPMKPLLSSQCR